MKNFAAIEQTGFLFIGSGARLRKKGAGGGIKALLKRLQAQRRRAARQSLCVALSHFDARRAQRRSPAQADVETDAELRAALSKHGQGMPGHFAQNALDKGAVHRQRDVAFADRKTKTDATRFQMCLST